MLSPLMRSSPRLILGVAVSGACWRAVETGLVRLVSALDGEVCTLVVRWRAACGERCGRRSASPVRVLWKHCSVSEACVHPSRGCDVCECVCVSTQRVVQMLTRRVGALDLVYSGACTDFTVDGKASDTSYIMGKRWRCVWAMR